MDEDESILTVSLKDLDNINSSNEKKPKTSFFGSQDGQEEEEENQTREQYRVVKKDLLFKVNFS